MTLAGGNLVPLLASSRVVGDVTKCPTFEMYFEFIARAMQAFAMWSLLVVPLCMFTLASSYEGGQHLDTRGGAIGPSSLNLAALSPLIKVWGQDPLTKGWGFVFATLDGCGVVLFLLFTLWMRLYMSMLAREYEFRHISVGKFAVKVENLPRTIGGPEDQALYEAELEAFFEQFAGEGAVREVALARNFDGQLRQYLPIMRLNEKIRWATQMKRDDEVAKLSKEITRLLEDPKLVIDEGDVEVPYEERAVFRAYVAFDTDELRDDIVALFNVHKYSIGRQFSASSRRFYDHSVMVSPAPEPTSILWENSDIEPCYRRVRRFGGYCVAFLILAVSGLVVLTLHRVLKSRRAEAAGGVACADRAALGMWSGVGCKLSAVTAGFCILAQLHLRQIPAKFQPRKRLMSNCRS
jgi:hypothetical protein